MLPGYWTSSSSTDVGKLALTTAFYQNNLIFINYADDFLAHVFCSALFSSNSASFQHGRWSSFIPSRFWKHHWRCSGRKAHQAVMDLSNPIRISVTNLLLQDGTSQTSPDYSFRFGICCILTAHSPMAW